MKLLVVSHTPHYLDLHGNACGWGATVREIDHLSALFDELIHIAPLHGESAPGSALPYKSPKVKYLPVKPAGGPRILDKIMILFHSITYLRVFVKELKCVDAVHIRAPANIAIFAMIAITFLPYPKLRWIKFAGNWKPDKPDALSYRFQRWWLRRGWHRGYVTVNGEWPDLPPFFRSFINPCLTDSQLQRGREVASNKKLVEPTWIIFVGAIRATKGIASVLEVVRQLNERGVCFTLDLIGDGSEKADLETLVQQMEIAEKVRFHGWLTRDEIDTFYERAHFILLPSHGEGWPKVLSEAMAFGVVPLASKVGSIPYFVEGYKAGHTYSMNDVIGYCDRILAYLHNPEMWKTTSQNATRLAERFSFAHYLEDVKSLFDEAAQV